MYFVNKFLEYLESFVTLAANHEDKDFVGSYLFGDYGLPEDFVQIAWYTSARGVQLEDGKGFGVIMRLNDMLNGTKRHQQDEVLDAYFLKYPEQKNKVISFDLDVK
ncbi:MAG: hypothetical protein LBB63_01705 [Holosporaceae bacterium]|jgi:hypothetical protein|nr:hypothetical protein [Holosporaceae bacterium]